MDTIPVTSAHVEVTEDGSVRDVSAVLDIASVDTGHRKRDSDLRKPGLLDLANHPQLTFDGTHATPLEGGRAWTRHRPVDREGHEAGDRPQRDHRSHLTPRLDPGVKPSAAPGSSCAMGSPGRRLRPPPPRSRTKAPDSRWLVLRWPSERIEPPHRGRRDGFRCSLAGACSVRRSLRGLSAGSADRRDAPGAAIAVDDADHQPCRPGQDLVHAGSDGAPESFTGLISGLHAGPVTIAADRFQFGIHVELTPWAAGALLGYPAGVLASGVYDVADVLGTRGSELVERTRQATDWTSRFAAIDQVLGADLDLAWTPAPEVAQAWTTLVRTGGRIPVQQLARHVGWSRRHLAERFRRELGLSPKTAARVIRFERSRTALTRPARAGLAEIAAECGYADQAHLTREWRDLAGQTPSAWIAAELPFVQAAVSEPATSSAHG